MAKDIRQKARCFSEKQLGCVIELFQKKSKQGREGVEDILFWKRTLEFVDLSLYPWIFQTKWSFTPGNSTNLCHTQKPGPMEIPHNFFLITRGNFSTFLLNFHILYFQYPWKFHILNPPCLFFSGITHSYLENGFAKRWFWFEVSSKLIRWNAWDQFQTVKFKISG